MSCQSLSVMYEDYVMGTELTNEKKEILSIQGYS